VGVHGNQRPLFALFGATSPRCHVLNAGRYLVYGVRLQDKEDYEIDKLDCKFYKGERMTLTTITTDALHDKIYKLAQRRRAGDHSTDNLLGRLLDEMDRRGDEAGEDEE